MADETKIIQDVSNAVDGLGASFQALSEILSRNIAGQKEQIGYINQLKKALGAKEFKDFVKISTDLSKAQADLAKQQKAALDIAKKDEQLKEQANKTALAAIRAAEAEALAQEKLKQAKERSWREEQKSIKEKEKAKRASDEAQSAYKKESDRLRELTQKAKDAAIQYGINSKEAKKLRAEQQALDKKIKDVDSSLGIHNRNVGNYGSALSGAKGLLAQFGIAVGGAQLAMKLFNGVIENSQAAGDAWNITLGGLKGSFEGLTQAIGKGEKSISAIIEKMRDGAKAGREYAAAIDDLFEGAQGAALQTAEIETKIAQAQVDRDKARARRDREEALRQTDIITQLEDKKLEIIVTEGNKRLEAERNFFETRTKLSQQDFEYFLKNYRKEEQLRSDATMYLTQRENNEKWLRAMRSAHAEASDKVVAAKKKVDELESTTSQSVKVYAELLQKWGGTTDEMVERYVNALTAIENAQRDSIQAQRRNEVARENELRMFEDENNKNKIETAKETNQLIIEEREELEDKIPDWIVTEMNERQKASDEYRALLEGDTKFLEGQQKDRDKITKDALEKELELRKEINSKTKELFGAATEAYFDIKAEGYERDLEENRAYYDGLLSNQLLDEEQRSLLEAQRDAKENEIKRKQRENEKKEFLFKKFQALGEIAISLAKANAAALVYGPILAPGIILKNKILAAMQTGIVMAQMLPMLDKGSKSTPENYIAGEKRPEIRIGKKGDVSIVDKPTVFTNDKGSTIIGGADTARIMDNINNYTTANIITEGKAVTESQLNMALFADKLIKSYGQNTDKIIRAVKSGSGGSDAKDRYYWQKTENLKNKLKS